MRCRLQSSFNVVIHSSSDRQYRTRDVDITFLFVYSVFDTSSGACHPFSSSGVYVRFQPVESDFREGHCTDNKKKCFLLSALWFRSLPLRKSQCSLKSTTNATFRKVFETDRRKLRTLVYIEMFKCLGGKVKGKGKGLYSVSTRSVSIARIVNG